MGDGRNGRRTIFRLQNHQSERSFEDRPVSIFSPVALHVPGNTYLEQKIEGVVEVTHGAEVEGKRAYVALTLAVTD